MKPKRTTEIGKQHYQEPEKISVRRVHHIIIRIRLRRLGIYKQPSYVGQLNILKLIKGLAFVQRISILTFYTKLM